MIKIYTSPSCSSCRKVKKWFDDNEIEYIEKNIFSPSLKESDIKEILQKSENGSDDIKIIKEGNIDIDEMTNDDFLKFVVQNPSVLKRPIIVDDTKIQVGYNVDEITVFTPEAKRAAEMECLLAKCYNYDCPLYSKEFEEK